MEMSRRYVRAGWAIAIGALSPLLMVSPAVAIGDANTAGCSNEALVGFRSELPDCRAYEMVSPLFKDGVAGHLLAVSADGNHVLSKTFGAFAETPSDSNQGAVYEFSRADGGWQAQAVSPPASQFLFQGIQATSPDLNRSLWLTRLPGQSIYAEDLYLREADGTFVQVGPLVPPSAAAGPPGGVYETPYYAVSINYSDASFNLSHVLLEYATTAPLWPGDTTAVLPSATNRSLYEFTGTGNQRPELVGVNSEGRLISNCKTDAGATGRAGSSDLYNAISADGATVFFTAVGHSAGEGSCPAKVQAPAINELYARLNGEETVPISEPAASACALCRTPVTPGEGRADGIFAGASEDGSQVFFLTTQALLEEAHTTNLYEYDFDAPPGAKVTRVSASEGGEAASVQGVARVSEDGSHVYFVAQGVLTGEPRGGEQLSAGSCLAELSQAELAEEDLLKDGRCRAKPGADNLYVYERDAQHPGGRVGFVATLCSGEEASGLVTGVKTCPSASTDETDWSPEDSRPVSATPEGRFLVFQSAGDLTAGDSSDQPQIFEYDARTGELVRVSIGRGGQMVEANSNGSSIVSPSYTEPVSPVDAVSQLAVSDDGSTVAFESVGALTEEAQAAHAAGVESVYEYRSTGSIRNGDVYLMSDGASMLPNSLLGTDPSGADIFFETLASLVPGDTDTEFDMYDARVDGGFAQGPGAAECAGEGCLAARAQPPILGAPSTNAVIGTNAVSLTPPIVSPTPAAKKPKATVRCAKGERVSHGRCVKFKGKRRSRSKSKNRPNSRQVRHGKGGR